MALQDFYISFALLTVSSAAAMGALAIWAGLSRRHWFVRLAVLAVPVAALVAVPAYDLLLLFLSEGLLVAAALVVSRRLLESGSVWRAERRLQFSLGDLLLLTSAVGSFVALAKHLPPEVQAHWPAWVGIGAGLSLPVLIGVLVVRACGRWWWRIGYWAIASPVAFLLRAAIADVDAPLGPATFSMMYPLWLWCVISGGLALVVAVWLGLAQRSELFVPPNQSSVANETSPTPRERRAAQIVLVALSLVLLTPPGVAYYQMLHILPIPETRLPNPNAYDELVRIAEALPTTAAPDPATASEEELQAFVEQHRRGLNSVRAALQRESRLPLKFEPKWFDSGTGTGALPFLARALQVEGTLAEKKRRPDDAALCHLCNVRLGPACARGGLVIHLICGLTWEGKGLDGLCRVRGSLSRAMCRRLISALVAHEKDWEPLEAFAVREQIWTQHCKGWRGRIALLKTRSGPASIDIEIRDRCSAQLRLLVCDLAVRLYEMDHDRPPERLEELLSGYLTELPVDPFSGRPFVYCRTADDFLLYSVGPDGRDDGGHRPASNVPGVGDDLLLDAAPAE